MEFLEFIVTGKSFHEFGPVFMPLVRAKKLVFLSKTAQMGSGTRLFDEFILNPNHTEFP